MGKGFGGMMKQAQQLQARMIQLQEEVGQRRVEASAGGGMVVAVINGKRQLLELKIAPEATEDIEMLQDMIVAAVNSAQAEAQEMMEKALSGLTGGLKLPGMF
jgi:DNA-binding YbaB/EbfC family protein